MPFTWRGRCALWTGEMKRRCGPSSRSPTRRTPCPGNFRDRSSAEAPHAEVRTAPRAPGDARDADTSVASAARRLRRATCGRGRSVSALRLGRPGQALRMLRGWQWRGTARFGRLVAPSLWHRARRRRQERRYRGREADELASSQPALQRRSGARTRPRPSPSSFPPTSVGRFCAKRSPACWPRHTATSS